MWQDALDHIEDGHLPRSIELDEGYPLCNGVFKVLFGECQHSALQGRKVNLKTLIKENRAERWNLARAICKLYAGQTHYHRLPGTVGSRLR